MKKSFFIVVCCLTFLLPSLVTTAHATEPKTNVRILSIGYIPRNPNDPSLVDREETGYDIPTNAKITDIQSKINRLTTSGMEILTDGSRYKGYRQESPPAVTYELVQPTIFRMQPFPRGMSLSATAYRPDYRGILDGLDICRYVDELGVSQVWLWGYHSREIVPVESNMSMGEASRKYFNHGTYGDVSNSEGTDDLPRCQSTYTLYNYHYGRDIGEVIEDHTHHLEAVIRYANEFNEPRDSVNAYLFWDNFVGATNASATISKPGCGWTHYPPNGRFGYDWYNREPVLSNCEDWRPDGSGVKKSISCQTWSKTSDCPEDGGISFKRWWMQNLPGLNNGLKHNGVEVKNWWLFISDYDYAMNSGGGLLVRPTQTPTPTPTPTPRPTPTPSPSPSPTSSPTATPSATPPPHPLDINTDGRVDIFDYNLLIEGYGLSVTDRRDINGDGIVNIADISVFVRLFSV